MNRIFYFLSLIFIIIGCDDSKDTSDVLSPVEPQFYKGMDLSFQSELEKYDLVYKDENGKPITLLDYVSENGTNLVRLKLWHTPLNGQNSLSDVKAYALKIKSRNMDFLLDFHYSDTWADPGSQTPPQAWQNMNFDEIKNAIYNYTKEVLLELKEQNTLPKIIQIGNETDSGFLWNYGKVWNEHNDNWPNYAALVKEAIKGTKEVDPNNNIQIMLHHSSVENAIYFFNELQPYHLEFDIIGLSYYPQFQTKDLGLVKTKLNTLATTFNKDILMVEMAYPFTLEWNDKSINFIGDDSQILTEFSATPWGQKAYLEWLVNTVKSIPNQKGIGFCYWAPDWVAFVGNGNTSTNGSAWENQCMFDFDHKALPIFDVFRNN